MDRGIKMSNLTVGKKSGVNYNISEEFMPYVVKKIGGKLYVYRQFRVGEKVITKYIGSLNKIVDFYIKNKNILKECPGRDLNPGSPAREAGIL